MPLSDAHRPPPVPIELIGDARWRSFDPAEWFARVPAEVRGEPPDAIVVASAADPAAWSPERRNPIPDHSPELGRAFVHEILRRNRDTVSSIVDQSPDAAPHLRTHPDDLDSVTSAALHWLVPTT